MITLKQAVQIANESMGEDFEKAYDTWQEAENAFVFWSNEHEGAGGFGGPCVVWKDGSGLSFDYAGYAFSNKFTEATKEGDL